MKNDGDQNNCKLTWLMPKMISNEIRNDRFGADVIHSRDIELNRGLFSLLRIPGGRLSPHI